MAKKDKTLLYFVLAAIIIYVLVSSWLRQHLILGIVLFFVVIGLVWFLIKSYNERHPDVSIFAKLKELLKPAFKESSKPARIPIPEEIKEQVFERAGHKCQYCGNEISPQIHHIDGDRTNNNPKNLIVLCPNHHKESDLKAIPKSSLYALRDKKWEEGMIRYHKD